MGYKISIIVPIYNTKDFLAKCIKSLMAQTYKNIEIILVNDGSTDDSLSICKKFAELDDRIIVINKSNGGVSSARNKGIEIATGDFLGFVDSDDYISPLMYEKLIHAIKEFNADIAECGYINVSSDYNKINTKLLNKSFVKGKDQCRKKYLSKSNTTNFNCNKLYRRSILDGVRYEKLHFSEDYVFNAKVFSNCNKYASIDQSLYYYVNHKESVTSEKFSIKKLDIVKAGKIVFEFYDRVDPELQRYASFYIINNIKKLYREMYQFYDDDDKLNIEKKLLKDFYYYFSLIKKEIFRISYKKINFFSLWFFYFNPNLYSWIMKSLQNVENTIKC